MPHIRVVDVVVRQRACEFVQRGMKNNPMVVVVDGLVSGSNAISQATKSSDVACIKNLGQGPPSRLASDLVDGDAEALAKERR